MVMDVEIVEFIYNVVDNMAFFWGGFRFQGYLVG